MNKYILLLLSFFVLSSCGSTEISSQYFEKNYDAETLTLDLSNESISSIPEFSQYMTAEMIQQVVTIDISKNTLQSIPEGSFDIFTSLSTINLDANSFKAGSDINIPKTITDLSLSDNDLEDIDGFNRYGQLTKLNLNNNDLEDLDLAELGGFKRLGLLEVEGNNISPELLEKINAINNAPQK